MLRFIISMPPEGCSYNRGHTMPFVANEIFLCELAAISSKFFTPGIAEKIELVDYAMTPDSSMKVSNDSLLFPSVKSVD